MRDRLPKAEMLALIGSLVARVRLCSAYCGKDLTVDAARLDAALTAIEEDHAATIDNYQDGLYRKHNVRAPQLMDGLSGRWGGYGVAAHRERLRKLWASL